MATSGPIPMEVDTGRPSRPPFDERKRKALEDYRKKLNEYRDVEDKLKERKYFLRFLSYRRLRLNFLFLVRVQEKKFRKEYDKSENDLKALQSVGQIVGEVLKQLSEEKCKCVGFLGT